MTPFVSVGFFQVTSIVFGPLGVVMIPVTLPGGPSAVVIVSSLLQGDSPASLTVCIFTIHFVFGSESNRCSMEVLGSSICFLCPSPVTYSIR
ncbi:hypothetical protein WR25_04593 [Diploscapter pachys]|uniref:Uncharacterized protein n=1 Tax=Diploscapter pachys TaxID=2018661 RepID=A0A2A2LL98_9BILA|nr:hypothetical protein WR25_04593 [Diploscapter pachys]